MGGNPLCNAHRLTVSDAGLPGGDTHSTGNRKVHHGNSSVTGKEMQNQSPSLFRVVSTDYPSFLSVLFPIVFGGFTAYFFFTRNDSLDRKSTRLNSSHLVISYAVFCLTKK